MKRHAIVVGGAGFIGSNLTDALIREGWSVDVIDNLVGGKRENVHPDAHFYELDIRDREAITPIIAGADVLFHLAALPSIQFSIEQPHHAHDVNTSGMLNVLIAAKDGGVGRVVYSASASAYGDHDTLPLHEELPARPLSPYALQKYIGEKYLRLFTEVYGMKGVSLRYFNAYGPRMSSEGAYALAIAKFLDRRKKGLPLPVVGDGEQTRDFIHVRDIVRANILAATSDKVGNGEVINVGSGQRTSINTLVRFFGGEVEYVPQRIESRDSEADNARARELLGWTPSVTVEEGIRELLKEAGIS